MRAAYSDVYLTQTGLPCDRAYSRAHRSAARSKSPDLSFPPTTMSSGWREAEQTERAYQKQDAIFLGKQGILAKKSGKNMRFYRNVGLGFKTPALAIKGSYCQLATSRNPGLQSEG